MGGKEPIESIQPITDEELDGAAGGDLGLVEAPHRPTS